MPHHWDIARAAKAPAVKTTIQIDPTRISVRIKNKLLKWLEHGEFVGGYSSKTRRLAEMLSNNYDLPASLKHWAGLCITSPSPELADELIELLKADWSAACLEYPHMANDKHWYKQRFTNHLQALERRHNVQHLYMHNNDFQKQAHVVCDKYNKETNDAARKACIEALKGTELITCMILEN